MIISTCKQLDCMLSHLTMPRDHNPSSRTFLYGFSIFSRMVLETIGRATTHSCPPGYTTANPLLHGLKRQLHTQCPRSTGHDSNKFLIYCQICEVLLHVPLVQKCLTCLQGYQIKLMKQFFIYNHTCHVHICHGFLLVI